MASCCLQGSHQGARALFSSAGKQLLQFKKELLVDTMDFTSLCFSPLIFPHISFATNPNMHQFGVQAAKPGLLTPKMQEHVSSANPSSGELALTVLSSVSALKIALPEAAQNSPHSLILQKTPSKHLADEC